MASADKERKPAPPRAGLFAEERKKREGQRGKRGGEAEGAQGRREKESRKPVGGAV